MCVHPHPSPHLSFCLFLIGRNLRFHIAGSLCGRDIDPLRCADWSHRHRLVLWWVCVCSWKLIVHYSNDSQSGTRKAGWVQIHLCFIRHSQVAAQWTQTSREHCMKPILSYAIWLLFQPKKPDTINTSMWICPKPHIHTTPPKTLWVCPKPQPHSLHRPQKHYIWFDVFDGHIPNHTAVSILSCITSIFCLNPREASHLPSVEK